MWQLNKNFLKPIIVCLTICLLILPFSTSLKASIIPAHASVSSNPTIQSDNFLTYNSLNNNNYVYVKDSNSIFGFNLTVLPTLILSPSVGPIRTAVEENAYGFPANIDVYLYWYQYTYGDSTYYWTNNATTGSNGQFNVTVKFTVPHTYGGGHLVTAFNTYLGTSWLVNSSLPTYVITNATFTPDPTIQAAPYKIATTTTSFSASLMSSSAFFFAVFIFSLCSVYYFRSSWRNLIFGNPGKRQSQQSERSKILRVDIYR